MKLLKRLVVLALVAFIALGAAGWFLVPKAAKGAVEQGSKYAFGVPTTLGSLGTKLGFSTSGMSVEGYRVASPDGFDGKPLLEIGKLGFGVGTRSLLGEPKVVDELVLEGLELHLLQKGAQSNVLPVLQQVRRLAGGGAKAPEGDGAPSSPGPRVKVRRVRIAGLAANIELSGLPGGIADVQKRFELPAYDADWSKLSGENGVTVAELAGKLLEDVTASALAKADEHLPAAASALLRASVAGGLSGGAAGAVEAAKDAARSELEKGRTEAVEKAKEFAADGLDKVKEGVSGVIGEDAAKQLEGALQGAVGSEPAKAIEGALEGAVEATLGSDAAKKVEGAVGSLLGGATGGTTSGTEAVPAPKVETPVAGTEATQKAAEGAQKEAEKATEKAVEKTEKALKGVLPGGAKDLLGKKPGG